MDYIFSIWELIWIDLMNVFERYIIFKYVLSSRKIFPFVISHIVEKCSIHPPSKWRWRTHGMRGNEHTVDVKWPVYSAKGPIVVSLLEDRYYFIWIYLIKRCIVSWLQDYNYFECKDICIHCIHKQRKLFLIIPRIKHVLYFILEKVLRIFCYEVITKFALLWV